MFVKVGAHHLIEDHPRLTGGADETVVLVTARGEFADEGLVGLSVAFRSAMRGVSGLTQGAQHVSAHAQ